MRHKDIIDSVLKDMPGIAEILFHDEKKNFNLAVTLVTISVLHLKPAEVRTFIVDFLIRHTKHFDLMSQYMSYSEMIHNFLAMVKNKVWDIQKCGSDWYKALNFEINDEFVQYIQNECEYFDEVPVKSVQDVQKATGCNRTTVYNYIKKLKIKKFGEGNNAFKERDYQRLVLAISTKNKNV